MINVKTLLKLCILFKFYISLYTYWLYGLKAYLVKKGFKIYLSKCYEADLNIILGLISVFSAFSNRVLLNVGRV